MGHRPLRRFDADLLRGFDRNVHAANYSREAVIDLNVSGTFGDLRTGKRIELIFHPDVIDAMVRKISPVAFAA